MDTSLDTSKNRVNENIYFPFSLENKTVHNPGAQNTHNLERNQGITFLQKFIDTKNFDYLLRAIKLDCTILQGRRVNDPAELNINKLTGDEIVDLFDSSGLANKLNLVTPSTVVWESINHLRRFFLYPSDKEHRDKVRNLLRRVGNALVPENVSGMEYFSKDWLMHVIPNKEGTKEKMTFMDPEKFYEYYNKVSNLFIKDMGEVKDREERIYSIIKTQFSKELNELKKAQERFYDGWYRVNFDITEDDIVDRFELTTKKKSIASIIAWVHERLCYYCQQKRTDQVRYNNILKLYNKAEDYVERGNGDYEFFGF